MKRSITFALIFALGLAFTVTPEVSFAKRLTKKEAQLVRAKEAAKRRKEKKFQQQQKKAIANANACIAQVKRELFCIAIVEPVHVSVNGFCLDFYNRCHATAALECFGDVAIESGACK